MVGVPLKFSLIIVEIFLKGTPNDTDIHFNVVSVYLGCGFRVEKMDDSISNRTKSRGNTDTNTNRPVLKHQNQLNHSTILSKTPQKI